VGGWERSTRGPTLEIFLRRTEQRMDGCPMQAVVALRVIKAKRSREV
jgi:hypothetical protein